VRKTLETSSRFNGLPLAKKPLKRFYVSYCYTGLKPGVNEMRYPWFGNYYL